ncbi:hypothetical protein M5689_018957 [Euphorbia peplus]|nr:hypothetical protein M5689_018957 [Euphorbia peplus]
MDLINSVRPTPQQFQTALNVQKKLDSQGALGIPVVSGQTVEKSAQQSGPSSGMKRQNVGDGSSGAPPPQKKSRN